ncbi:hypothetical protein [Dyadobacter tibetensis]|nr:hypothetical protein [Dyadobacter tibetensis]
MKSLQWGATGMSSISANFYPEVHSWLCRHANDPAKKADGIWLQ